MAKLINKTKNNLIVTDLKIADSMLKRMKGYMFKESLNENEALLIPYANSIHTFFMNFNLDIIFLDNKNSVKKIVENLKPKKIIFPVLSSTKVIELHSGAIQKYKIEVGDTLYVEA